MSDRPDFETDTNISSQTVGDLAVEVAAQTVNQLGVDIEAQTVSDLGIDIQTQSLGEQVMSLNTERSRDIVNINKDKSSTIPDNTGETVTFTPPPGSVFELRSVHVDIQATGGNGSHSFGVTNSATGFGTVLAADFPGTEGIDVNGNVVGDSGQANSVTPSTEEGQIASTQTLAGDPDEPIELSYFNLTNEANTQTRRYTILVDQIDVA